MAEITSKVETLELLNGKTVELTLNFSRLLWLRNNGYTAEVAAAMAAINGKTIDMLDMPYLFYAAYLCATQEPEYNQQEFIKLIPFDLEETSMLFASLISKKKADVSKMRSSAKK